MRWIKWFLMDQAGGNEQGGGGGGGSGGEVKIDPAQARTFLDPYVPDPAALATMPDDQVLAHHARVSSALTKAQQEAIKNYDWRKDVAGDNADVMKTLGRFASPKALYESYDQFRTKLSKGELKAITPFPEKGTAEQQAEWRTQNGVPADGKYEIKLAQGLKFEEADQPFIDSMTKAAHAANVPASAVNAMANWFVSERRGRAEAQAEALNTLKRETEDTLRGEWGNDYRGHINRIQGLLDSTIPAADTELKALINNAIATNPTFARHYVQMALQLNPTGALPPGDSGSQEKTLTDELKSIETVMRTKRGEYNKDEKMQARYRDLLTAYQQVTKKAWAS